MLLLKHGQAVFYNVPLKNDQIEFVREMNEWVENSDKNRQQINLIRERIFGLVCFYF